MNFLESLLDLTDQAETPKPFIYWAGLSAISAVARRNVWFDKNYYKVYPNIFVMLVGNPGTRKSFATNLCRKLVDELRLTRIITGTNSIEGIIKDLGTAKTDENGGPPNILAHTLVVSNEFTNLLLDNPQALSYMTELYDACYNETWQKRLISGTINLKEPTVTFLTATNPAHFKDKISSVDIEGGFIGRTHLVVCNKKNRINALIRKIENKFEPKVLLPSLREIAEIHGEFKFESEEVIKYYEEWYEDINNTSKEDNTGATERIQDHVLKIAMILSLSRKKETIFTMDDITQAIETCMNLTANIKSVTVGIGISDRSAKIHKFMSTLISQFRAGNPRVRHDYIQRKHYGDFDQFDLTAIIEAVSPELVTVDREGKWMFYRLTDSALQEFFRLEKEEN